MVVWFGKIEVRVQWIFCKKVLRIRTNATKVVAVSKLANECSVGRFGVLQQNTGLVSCKGRGNNR